LKDGARIDPAIRSCRVSRSSLGAAVAVAFLQPFRPGPVDGRLAVPSRGHDGVEREHRGRQDFRFATAIVNEFACRVGETDELGGWEYCRRAVAELIVKLASDHEHRICFGHRRCPHSADDRWMICRHEAATFLRIEIDGAERVEEPDDFRPCVASAAAGDDERPLRRPEHFYRVRDDSGVGRNDARFLALHPLFEDEVRRDMGAQYVGRDFEVNWTRFAKVAECAGNALVELPNHLIGDAKSARLPRHRPQNVDVRNILQRAQISLRARGAAANHQNWRSSERGVGDPGGRIGHTRPGRNHGDAKLAREFSMGVRHVDRRDFMANIDDADP
jgi:hypothetical protein